MPNNKPFCIDKYAIKHHPTKNITNAKTKINFIELIS